MIERMFVFRGFGVILRDKDPVRVIEALRETDISNASAADIPGLFRQLRQIQGWASTIEGQIARRASELEAAGEGIAAGDAIARGKRSSAREAKRTARRGDVLGKAPDLEQQRGAARFSYGINDEAGMGWIRREVHPDDLQRVKRRLDARVKALGKQSGNDRLDHAQLAARAFVELITGARASSQPLADLMVLIDLPTLINGLHSTSVCEYSDGSPLPVETARRHACNASIIPAVLDSEGMPTDVGRGARVATPAQRRALRSTYRTCAVDGCEHDFDACEIHHIIEWAYKNGYTDLLNLLPLCSYHHHRAHEGRWRLQLDPSTRELSVFLSDGTLLGRCLPDMLAERAA